MKSTDRLAFIDWTRGLAAVIMLQGHTFHSFTRPDLRDKGTYTLSQFVGGLPPAMFLLLTGITFAFLMDSQESKGAATRIPDHRGAEAVSLPVHSGVPVSFTALRVRLPRRAPRVSCFASTF